MAEKKPRKAQRHLWYLETPGGIKGPYPTKQMRQYLLLGRLTAHHSVSLDQIEWFPIGELKEFRTGGGLSELLSPGDQQELAMRNADERGGTDRRLEVVEGIVEGIEDEQRGAEDAGRREEGPVMGVRRYRQKESIFAASIRGKRWLNLLVAFALFIPIMAVFTFYRGDIIPEQRDCNSPSAPGVNWNTCNKNQQDFSKQNLSSAVMSSMKLVGARFNQTNLEKADLSYSIMVTADLSGANLQNAKLIGTSLEFTSLANTNFKGADLSYANLEGADAKDADFSNAKLGKTVWMDGKLCAVNSVGQCN